MRAMGPAPTNSEIRRKMPYDHWASKTIDSRLQHIIKMKEDHKPGCTVDVATGKQSRETSGSHRKTRLVTQDQIASQEMVQVNDLVLQKKNFRRDISSATPTRQDRTVLSQDQVKSGEEEQMNELIQLERTIDDEGNQVEVRKSIQVSQEYTIKGQTKSDTEKMLGLNLKEHNPINGQNYKSQGKNIDINQLTLNQKSTT